ncbi:hypothetical protein EOD42_23445 [Rhodovarius crocodyli]|uniref:Uncharacterized protein n=1 Tax=Rhodovarius crocodyli TaxID=1979269 RepID=A0A437LYU5_9PROT|nr:hypothetical protein [Rhodovarius crocodyli]RVT90590.1 hypothetical protein EOD42_23445 [Rhodovarius crocodyli]
MSLEAPVGPVASGDVATRDFGIEVAEASVSVDGYLCVRLRSSDGAAGLPDRLDIRVGDAALGQARLLPSPDAAAGGGFLHYARLPEGWCEAPAPMLRVLLPEGGEELLRAPLSGRLTPASGAWFADATWTADADVMAVVGSSRPSVLILADVLPGSAIGSWAPVANLAAAVRLAGFRTVFVHFGARPALDAQLASLLSQMDVVHHIELQSPMQEWSSSAPGALPPIEKPLTAAIEAIAKASGCAMIVGASVASLFVLGKIAGGPARGALLSRAFVLGPRMIFAPVPREKAIAALRGVLKGVSLIVEDEGLRVELGKWMPEAPSAVLPVGPALAAAMEPAARSAEVILGIGQVAHAAMGLVAAPGLAVWNLPGSAGLTELIDALTMARFVVLSPDAGPLGALAAGLAAAQGVAVIGQPPLPLPVPAGEEAAVRLAALVEARLSAADPALAAPASDWSARAFASELGLFGEEERSMAGGSLGVLKSVLATRLNGLPDKAGVGLMIEPGQPGGGLLAAAFVELCGQGRVFASNPAAVSAQAQPLSRAAQQGVHTVLIDPGPSRRDALSSAQRALDSGLMPWPLAPRATWIDRVAFTQLRGVRRGATAYIGQGPVPIEAAVVLCPGWQSLPLADVVELSGPDDPRRGRLLTMFCANSDVFWRRPPAPAAGYDRVEEASGLEIEHGVVGEHPVIAMLAAALLLGCTRVLLAEEHFREPGLARTLAAMGDAGVTIQRVTSLSAPLMGGV